MILHPDAALIAQLPQLPTPRKVLRASPQYFALAGDDNIFMTSRQQVDTAVAQQEWDNLTAQYAQWQEGGLLDKQLIVSATEGLPDQVFTANPALPFLMPDGKRIVVPSRMRHAARQGEVPLLTAALAAEGYEVLPWGNLFSLEGNGDLLPHPERRLLFGGYGFRTQLEALQPLSQMLQVPIVPLHLTDPHGYHLDTCFLPVSNNTVLIVPEAFDRESLDRIHSSFPEVLYVPAAENNRFMGLNAHILYHIDASRRVALVPAGATTVTTMLTGKGYRCTEVHTGEFLKSGGSIFCMKLMYW